MIAIKKMPSFRLANCGCQAISLPLQGTQCVPFYSNFDSLVRSHQYLTFFHLQSFSYGDARNEPSSVSEHEMIGKFSSFGVFFLSSSKDGGRFCDKMFLPHCPLAFCQTYVDEGVGFSCTKLVGLHFTLFSYYSFF